MCYASRKQDLKYRNAVTNIKLLKILMMENSNPSSIRCLLSILIIFQIANLKNRTSLMIINKQNIGQSVHYTHLFCAQYEE